MKLQSLLFLLLISKLYAQKNLIDGTIYLLNGESRNGSIEFVSMKSAKLKCIFIDGEGKRTVFSPNELFGYNIKNLKRFLSKKVVINGETINLFLQYLIDGNLDLYYLQHNGKEYYFIEKLGKLEIFETSNTIEKTEKNLSINYSDLQFKHKLKEIFNEALVLHQELNSAKLNQKELIYFVKKYHQFTCDSISCIDYTLDISNKTKLFFETGLINNFYSYSESSNKLQKSFANIGFGVKNYTQKSGFKNFFKIGVELSKHQYSKRFVTMLGAVAGLFPNYLDVSNNYFLVGIPLKFGRKYFLKKSYLELAAGVNPNFVFDINSELKGFTKYEDYSLFVTETNKIRKFNPAPEFEINYFLGKNGQFAIGSKFGYRRPVPRVGNYSEYIKTLYIIPTVVFNFK